MRDGKPDGYWKTYHENGFIKSEGNRKDFKLDSIWNFYSDSGTRSFLKITYLEWKKKWGQDYFPGQMKFIEENFVNDVKQGLFYHLLSRWKTMEKSKFH